MNPIGLTRAEEAALDKRPDEPRVIVKPPPGAPSCRITVLPEGHACGALATVRIIWPDDDKTPACVECAGHTSQLAQSHRSAVRIEPLR